MCMSFALLPHCCRFGRPVPDAVNASARAALRFELRETFEALPNGDFMKQLLSLITALFLSIGMAFGAVNVNTATQAELETLNGIGPAKAKAIIDHRTKHGPFKSFEDLDKVSGIGEG